MQVSHLRPVCKTFDDNCCAVLNQGFKRINSDIGTLMNTMLANDTDGGEELMRNPYTPVVGLVAYR